jgi:hypothetical protein
VRGLPVILLVLIWSRIAAGISLVGQLDPNNPQDAFLFAFDLSAPGQVRIQSWGYGGTSNAPDGTNAAGMVIPPGGFDPYVSVFNGVRPAATFVASNDDGACPPGAVSAGKCYDSALAVNLSAGSHTLSVTAFLNMSFAENLGTGTLDDGFIGLGSFGGRTNAFAVDIEGSSVVAPDRLLAANPNALTFGPQTLNITSGQLVLQVASVGALPVNIETVTVAGANASEFAVGGNCAGAVLQPTELCTVSVTFRPTAIGPRSAVITINSNAGNDPLTVNVGGSGTNSVTAGATLSATGLDFGSTQLNQTSSPRTITVTNTGTASLIFGANVLGGANPGDFAVLADNCAMQTIAPGNACTFNVAFAPLALGPRSATLTFNSNASNNPVTVTLQGRGVIAQPAPLLGHAAFVVLFALLALIALVGLRRLAKPIA